jgi:hypothetical protein
MRTCKPDPVIDKCCLVSCHGSIVNLISSGNDLFLTHLSCPLLCMFDIGYLYFRGGMCVDHKALKWIEWKETFCSIQIKILHIFCKIGSALSFSCYSWHAFVPRSMTFMNEPNFELCKRH